MIDPKVPKFIYLQCIDEKHDVGEVTWCSDKINDTDVEYVRLSSLTDAERLEIFADYCTHCGRNDPTCQCWNDE